MIIVSFTFGAVATVMVTLVARELSPRGDDWSTGLWWQLLPMSFLFCIGYSEALFVSAAALALFLSLRHRWVLAGIFGALSSAVLASGVVLALVGVVAATGVSGNRRSLRPLALTAIAPLGLLAYFVYLWKHIGTFFAWQVAEQRGWHIHEDFGIAAIKFAGYSVLHPTAHWWFDVVTVCMLLVIILLFFMIRLHLPWTVIAYVAGTLFLATTSGVSTLSSFPRVAFTAFPLFIPMARGISRLPVWVQGILAAIGVGLGCALAIVVTVSHMVVP